MTATPTFTIMLPIHRPPLMLEYAVSSVLEQQRQDFELLIICDGPPSASVEAAEVYAARDPRIRAFVFPKGKRNGELHRHHALQEAHGSLVCQIADDDLWFPTHLDGVAALLAQFDFGHLLQISLLRDGTPYCHIGDLQDSWLRARMSAECFNFFGPTPAAYRLSAYRALPVGWSPAPREIMSDLYMWRKFIAQPEIRCGTRFEFTSLHISTHHRSDMTEASRRAENAAWRDRLRDPQVRDAITQQALQGVFRQASLGEIGLDLLQGMAQRLGPKLDAQLHGYGIRPAAARLVLERCAAQDTVLQDGVAAEPTPALTAVGAASTWRQQLRHLLSRLPIVWRLARHL